MRIRELCESAAIELDADKKTQDKHGLGYDLIDDLIFFMHHDDDAYRRHTYPSIMQAQDKFHKGKQTDQALFGDAVKEAYSKYRNKFHNIRELPEKLDQETFDRVCEHLHTEELKKIEDGHYKD